VSMPTLRTRKAPVREDQSLFSSGSVRLKLTALAIPCTSVTLRGCRDKSMPPPFRVGGLSNGTQRCGGERKSPREGAAVQLQAGDSLNRAGSSAQRSGDF
jgi:hypothetical protein